MPRRQFGYSTIEPANVLEGKVDTSDVICYEVRTRRLDSFGL